MWSLGMLIACGGPPPLGQPNAPPEWPLKNLSVPVAGTALPAAPPPAVPAPSAAPASEVTVPVEPTEPTEPPAAVPDPEPTAPLPQP